MALTATREYTDYVNGEMRGRMDLLQKFNQAFTIEGQLQGAAKKASVYFNMWDNWTAATIAAGTRTTEGRNNLQVQGTLATTSVTAVALPHEVDSEENTRGLIKGAPKATDTLVRVVQNAVVAALKAATIAKTTTLPTGYVDFKVASAATNPDMVNNILGVVETSLAYVRAVGGDAIIIGNPDSIGRLTAMRKYADGMITREAGLDFFNGAPMFSIYGATNFGGANLETLFILDPTALGVKVDDAYVAGDGWVYDPYDGTMKWTLELPYAIGTVNTALMAEVVNGAAS